MLLLSKFCSNHSFYIVAGIICGALSWHFNQFIVVLLLAGVWYSVRHRQLLRFGCGLMLIIASFLIGTSFQGSRLDVQQTEWQGEIKTEPKIDGDSIQFQLNVTGQNECIVVYLKASSEAEREQWRESLHVGTVVSFSGALVTPQQLHNFSLFDYPHHLNIRGIYYITYIKDITVTGTVFSVAASIYQYIRNYFPDNIQPYLRAFVLGDMGAIEQTYTNIWQSLGVIHLFALSGFHIQFLIRSLRKIFSRLWVPQEAISLLLIGLLLFYMYLTGFSASVVRAGLMAIISIMFSLANRKMTSFGICSAVFISMSLANPLLLEQSGFQFSFLITYSIILSQKYFQKIQYGKQVLRGLLIQLVSLPVLIWHYYEFSLLTFIYNLIFIPFASVFIIPLVFLTFCFPFLSPLLEGLVVLFEHFSLLLGTIPQFMITIGRQPILYVIVITVVIVFIFANIELKKHVSGAILLLAALLFLPTLHPVGSVTIVDIGQGDCIILSIPFVDGAVVIDTGGKVKYGNTASWMEKVNAASLAERTILPTIKALGHHKIHTLFISHADQDHMGEAIQLAENIPIQQLVLSKSDAKLQSQLLAVNDEQWHIPVIFAQAGMNINIGGQHFQILLPDQLTAALDENNKSLVILSEFFGERWLFTGDLEIEGETELLSLYPELAVDHLKVGHHGSKTSSSATFINALKPQYGYISAGINNRYKHPHQITLDTLTDNHVTIFRTDIRGAIRRQYFWIWKWHEIANSG